MSVQLDDAVHICAIEAQYWAEIEDEHLIKFSMGAMGAASNICAALMRGLTPEQYRQEVAQRSSVSSVAKVAGKSIEQMIREASVSSVAKEAGPA